MHICTAAQRHTCTTGDAMKIVAIAMQKGGVGKSTLTRSLAVAASQSGLSVLILDMDTQQSSQLWSRRRSEDLEPAVTFSTENDLPLFIERARAAGCDLVIIDTPPARGSEAGAAVEACDLVLIPCTPAVESYEQLPKTARLARVCGKEAVAILNMATPNSVVEIETARILFEKVGVVMAPVTIARRKIHQNAAAEGLVAHELLTTSRGAVEISALWAWLCAQLHICTAAQPMKRSA